MKKDDFSLNKEFNSIVMSPSRFPLIVLIALYEEVDFTFLKKELQMSDGNLGANLKKLEEVNLIKSKKIFFGSKPKTIYKISQKGKVELENFIGLIKEVEKALEM